MGKRKFKRSVEGSLEERRRRIRQAKRTLAVESKGKSPKYSVEQLLDKADGCIDRFEYELAQKFCQRALEMEPDNILALETTGSLLLEVGNQEAAKQCFGRAVEVCPNKGHSKYMYLGQLFEGGQAVECFQKGIELMEQELEAKQATELAAACGGGPEDRVTREDISSAYLSLAELYMTDCCMEEDSDAKCEHYINKALEIDSESAEGYQMLASYHLSKSNEELATEMIKKSISLWLPKFKAADKGDVPDEEFDPLELTPLSYDTRITSAKILTEVKEYETAVDVLEGLLDEDDEVPQVWYMIGWANYLQGPDYKENTRYYLQQCKQIYAKVKCDDEDLLKHVEELMVDIGPDGDDEDDDGEVGEDVDEIESDEEETDNKTNGVAESMEH